MLEPEDATAVLESGEGLFLLVDVVGVLVAAGDGFFTEDIETMFVTLGAAVRAGLNCPRRIRSAARSTL